MLLYRVARKLRLKNNYSRHIPEIKALLQTSLQLLDETEHAEVRALLCVSHRACRGESTPLCVWMPIHTFKTNMCPEKIFYF